LINPSLTSSAVKQLLVSTVQPLAAWNGLVDAGGVVDQAHAIRAVAGM